MDASRLGSRRYRCAAAALLLLLPVVATAQVPTSGKIDTVAVQIGGRDRVYLRYVPANVRREQPLVIALHGLFGSGQGMRHETDFGFEKLADQHGFVVAYPQGALMGSWNDCRKQSYTPARLENVDDVGFLKEVIRAAVTDYGSDPTRVYLFGFSAGAHMAYRMAWEAPQDVAAIAAIGGNLPPPDLVTCASKSKTPRVLMIKGRADTGDPFDGGPHAMSGSVVSAYASAAAFAQQNGLSGPAAEVDVAPSLRLLAWPASGRPWVALYSVDGLGHMVPVSWRDKIDGIALAWKFFVEP